MARPQCDGLSYFPFDVDFFRIEKSRLYEAQNTALMR